MQVYVAALRIDLPASVETRPIAAQPENTREYPVTLGISSSQLRRPYLAGRTTADINTTQWLTSTDAGANAVLTTRSASGAGALAQAIERRRDRIATDNLTGLKTRELLCCDRDMNMVQLHDQLRYQRTR
jgi:hypothetical protein